MQYYSHYIWESGSEEKDNPVSVLLQQVSRKKHHYLLACVCDGEKNTAQINSYFTERLTEWFHSQFLEMILRRKVCSDGIYKCLEWELNKIRLELEEYCRQKKQKDTYCVRGILLCDDFFCLFQKGDTGCYLFNRRFNRRKRKKLLVQAELGLTLVQGNAQKKIGILLCNSAFGSSITEEEMISVLFEDSLDDRKIERRLREIRQTDLERGVGGAAGAVFIRLE